MDDLERYPSYFRGRNYFDGNDRAQNTLVFQTMQIYFKLSNKKQTDEFKSKGLSNQLNVVGTLGNVVLRKPVKPMHVIFKRKGTLVQNGNDIMSGGPIVNIYIVILHSKQDISKNYELQFCF